MDTPKQTFAEFCDETIAPTILKEFEVSTISGWPKVEQEKTRYEVSRGLTRFDHFVGIVAKEMIRDALSQRLELNGGFTSIQIAKDSSKMAIDILWSMYNTEKK